MLKKIINSNGQIVIGRQQTRAAADDAVAIMVGVARERNVELILAVNQTLHGVLRRGIHSYLPVPIERHERKRRINRFADDC